MKARKLLPLLLVSILTTSCSTDYSDRIFAFDTYININIASKTQEVVGTVKDVIKRFDILSDNYLERTENNIYTINHTSESIEIDEVLGDLLMVSQHVSNEGANYFSMFTGSLSKKWKESLSNGEVLSNEVIQEELEKINNTSLTISLDKKHVQKTGEAEIDLGGIVKGYMLDYVKVYLETVNNLRYYLINAGASSILLGEKKTDNGYYTVGLNDIPNSYIKLKNCFFSASGNLEQGVTIGDVTYSHIVNPFTGSTLTQYDTVRVVTESGYLGDALSTSLMLSSLEEIKKVEKDLNVQVIVSKDNQIVYKSDSLEVYTR